MTKIFGTALCIAFIFLSACTNKPSDIPPAGLAGTAAAVNNVHPDDSKGKLEIKGVVQEAINREGFGYLKIRSGNKDEWVAVLDVRAKVGENVHVNGELVKTDFYSKALERTFEKITFGTISKKDAS